MFNEYFEIQYYKALQRWQRAFTEQKRIEGGGYVPKPVWRHQMPHYFYINTQQEGVPILRGKKMFPEKALAETIWIMLGRNDLAYLHDKNVHYWDEFNLGDGTIGNSYGPRLRNLNGIDQLERVIYLLRNDPNSRQICISFWNPAEDTEIRPCYSFIQFKVIKRMLNMNVVQRSGDALIGVPNDAMVFTFFLAIIAYAAGLFPGIINYTVNDFHVYPSHQEALNAYLAQYPGWREIYTRIESRVSYSFSQWENYQSKSLQEFLENVDTAYDFLYDFSAYKSRKFIKVPLIKQSIQ